MELGSRLSLSPASFMQSARAAHPACTYAIVVAGLAALVCLVAPTAQAAGFRFIDIPADADGPALAGAV